MPEVGWSYHRRYVAYYHVHLWYGSLGFLSVPCELMYSTPAFERYRCSNIRGLKCTLLPLRKFYEIHMASDRRIVNPTAFT